MQCPRCKIVFEGGICPNCGARFGTRQGSDTLGHVKENKARVKRDIEPETPPEFLDEDAVTPAPLFSRRPPQATNLDEKEDYPSNPPEEEDPFPGSTKIFHETQKGYQPDGHKAQQAPHSSLVSRLAGAAARTPSYPGQQFKDPRQPAQPRQQVTDPRQPEFNKILPTGAKGIFPQDGQSRQPIGHPHPRLENQVESWSEPPRSATHLSTAQREPNENGFLKTENSAALIPEEYREEPQSIDDPESGIVGKQADIFTRIVSIDPERERKTRMVNLSSIPPMVKKSIRAPIKNDAQPENAPQFSTIRDKPKSSGDDAESEEMVEIWRSIKHFYLRLHKTDRLALGFTLMALLGAFFPWTYQLGEGLVSGVQGLGFFSTIGAAISIASLYLRTVRRRIGRLALFIQLFGASILTGVPVYLFFVSTDIAFQAGFFLTFGAGAVVIVFTLMRMSSRTD